MTDSGTTLVSVVIASRNRHADLKRCLGALDAQVCTTGLEVIVVDDGSTPQLRRDDYEPELPLKIVPGPRRGPAAARNCGLAAARGDLVLFTDDDTVPPPSWAQAAIDHLSTYPEQLGVEGPIDSAPWDPLWEYSIEGSGPGHYWTANIAYRRSALLAVGGLAEDAFPTAHAEDRDLAFRVERCGPIGYSEELRLLHTPRKSGYRAAYRRGLWSASDIVLERRHPDRVLFDNRVPTRLRYLVGGTASLLRNQRAAARWILRHPRPLLRSLLLQLSYVAGLVVAAIRVSSAGRDTDVEGELSHHQPQLSVIVPTRNGASRLPDLFVALARQTLSPDEFEVIVVSDGSTDETEVVVQASDIARLVPSAVGIGVPRATNLGVD